MGIVNLSDNAQSGQAPPRNRALAARADAQDPGHNQSEKIIVCAPTGRDGPLVAGALVHAGFDAAQCKSIADLCGKVREGIGAVFIAEESLSPQGMKHLREALRDQPAWSDIPVVVMTGGGKTTQYSQRIAQELNGIANLTLLERPLRILTLVSAVQAALRARRRQYQIHALLREKEQAVEQRDRFLAMLGHELRNPLAAIRTAVEVLSSAGPDDAELAREHCSIIKRQSANLSRLVDDLLDVARATAGKIVLDRQLVDLREIAQRSIEGVKLAMGVQRHEILVETSAEPATVFGDPVRLEQVVINLLSNAIKYTPAGGQIWIRVQRDEDDFAVFAIRDSGEGIPPDMLPRIFEPFVQVDQNLDRARGGLGLGLPLVQALVEMHRGTIHVTSAGPGLGSEFIVRFPLATPHSVPERKPPEPPFERGGACRILLVEDSPDARAAMRALLRLWGHQVVVAEDGPSGVQRAQEFKPEVALVDIGLPGLDGYGVANAIRKVMGQSIYLIALTGYGQPEDKERTRQAGFDEHLVKPVEPERLSRLLREISRRPASA
jgi:signal transduction histidine kinase/CheY-like chemotaxis protein